MKIACPQEKKCCSSKEQMWLSCLNVSQSSQRVEVTRKWITESLQEVLSTEKCWAQNGMCVDQFWLSYPLNGRPKLLGRRTINIAHRWRETDSKFVCQSLNLSFAISKPQISDNYDYRSYWFLVEINWDNECKSLSTGSGIE